MATHLIPLDNSFQLWRTFCLRSTGFPARHATALGSPEAARAADAAEQTQSATDSAAERLLQACSVDGVLPTARTLLKAVRERQPAPGPFAAEYRELAEAYEAARAASEAAALEYARALQAAIAAARGALREFAARRDVRAAIAWQNPTVLVEGINRYLASAPDTADKKARQREQLLTNYVQRYCLKNESIGFFGPIGWGQWSDSEGSFHHGPHLHRGLRVYLERWAATDLGQHFAALDGARRWLSPLVSPLVRFEAPNTLHTLFGPLSLTPAESVLVAQSTGSRTINAIADEAGLRADEVLATLDGLEARGFVSCKLQVPWFPFRYEEPLLRWAETLPAGELKSRVAQDLGRVMAAFEEASAADEPDRIATAQRTLEQVFSEVTDRSATRRPGEMYAGRTLLRFGSTRDVEIELPEVVRQRVGRPLSLLMASARWWSSQVFASLEPKLEKLFDEASRVFGGEEVPLAMFYPMIASLFPIAGGTWPEEVAAITDELHQKWRDLFGEGERRIVLDRRTVSAAVASAFPATSSGWPSARVHSPDIMIGATSFEALQRGDFSVVLGEAHYFGNTLEQGVFFREFPNKEQIAGWFRDDHPNGRLVPSRLGHGLGCSLGAHPRDVLIESDPVASEPRTPRTEDIANFIVKRIDGRIHVIAPRLGRVWGIRAALDALLSDYDLPLLPAAPHTPRVTIEELVVARETWRPDGDELGFAVAKTQEQRFRGARRFAAKLGLPRYCFFKVSSEVKPQFVDFTSPHLIELFCKAIRGGGTLTVSEMLPTPDECWLRDAQGEAYTSEVRLVIVDDLNPPPSSAER